MIFLGLVCLCEQNVVRTSTTADHKQPSPKSSGMSIKIKLNGSRLTGWIDWSASVARAISLDWLGCTKRYK